MIKRRLITTAMVCALGMSVSGCGHFGQSKPKYSPAPEIAETTGEAKVVWKDNALSSMKQYANIAPKIDGLHLYAADHKGKLIALNKQSGQVIWEQNTKQPITAGPNVVADWILVGTSRAEVLAFNKHSGQQIWRATVPSEVLAAPNGNQDLILVNTVDGKLSALDYQTGAIRWIYDRTPPALILRRSSMPQVAGDIALAGFSSGKLVALRKDSGIVLWERLIAEPKGRSELHRMVDIAIDPVVDGRRVFVGSMKGNLTAMDIKTGEVFWEANIPVLQNFSHSGDRLYLTDADNHVVAVDKQTGAVLWRQDRLVGRPLTGTAVSNQWIIVGDSLGMIYWIDKNTGKLAGSHDFNHPLLSDLIISDNKLYLQGKNGTLAAIQIVPAQS